MKFYKELHEERKFNINFKNNWFWIRLGKLSFQSNFNNIENC